MDNVYVLASAFLDGESIVPVMLEIKEFSDKENTLYVAIALESIKKNEIVKQEVAEKGVAQQYSPSFNISIAKFFGKINPNDSAHRVLLPDGSEFRFSNEKNAEPTVAGVKGKNRRQGPAISSASNISIPDSSEKINPSEESSSQEVGEAQFPLAKSEDGKAHPYTKRGAEIVRGLAVETVGILAVALTKIEADVMGDTVLRKEERTRLLSTSTYSIPRFVKKINSQDENFFKYIPDEFLTEEQRLAKSRALAKDEKKYGYFSDFFVNFFLMSFFKTLRVGSIAASVPSRSFLICVMDFTPTV